jgi:hypothetical protein
MVLLHLMAKAIAFSFSSFLHLASYILFNSAIATPCQFNALRIFKPALQINIKLFSENTKTKNPGQILE